MKRIKHAIISKISLEAFESLLFAEQFIADEKRKMFAQLKKEATKKSRLIIKRQFAIGYHMNDFVDNQKTMVAAVYTVKGPRIIGKGKVFKCQRPGYRPYHKRPKTRLRKMVNALRNMLEHKAMAMQAYAQHIQNVINMIKPIPKYPPVGVISPGRTALIGHGIERIVGTTPRIIFNVPESDPLISIKNAIEQIKQMNFRPEYFLNKDGQAVKIDQVFPRPWFGMDFANNPPKNIVSLHEFDPATDIIRRVTDNFRIGYSWEFDDKPMPEPPATTTFTIRFTPPINFLAIVKVFLAKHPDAWHPLFYPIHCFYHTIMLLRHFQRRAGIIST